jgi:hypothetical protein
MPGVLQPSNAFPGIPFPNHLSGQTPPQNYQYPGAVQPRSTAPSVLTYAEAFPGIPFPNHLTGQSKPQNYLFPGAAQPIVFGGSMIFTRPVTLTVTGSVEVTLP